MTGETVTMWLDTIHFELDALEESEIIPPDEPPAANETIVGEVTHNLHKRLFTLARKYAYEADKCNLEERYGNKKGPPGERERWGARAHIIGLLFWTEVRNQMEGYGSDLIGLRGDWKLVTSPEPPKSKLGKLIGLIDEE